MWVYSVSLVSVVFIILPHSKCRFEDVNAADIVRHVLPDVVVLIISVISLLFLIYKAFCKKQSSNMSQQQKRQPKDATVSNGNHSINSDPKLGKHSERSKGRSLILLLQQPSSSAYLSVSWSFTFIFLLWLSGVCTASVLNFPYFISSVYLALCWGLHLNRKTYFLITQRIIVILTTLYSSIHLILLYVYQLQSVQDLVPRPSVTARCACMYACIWVCVCVCVCVCVPVASLYM